jgi:hypothetical protein
MIMRMSWIGFCAVVALALIVLLMAAQFAPSVLGAALAISDFG